MAVFGCCYPKWAPFTGAEPENALPKYGTAVNLGKLASANLTVNNATGDFHGDNKVAERVTEFTSGELAIETDDVLPKDKAAVYGATYDEEKGIAYKDNDAPPWGGIAYYKTLQVDGAVVYECCFYPKAKAQLGNDSVSTKGSSITFAGTTTTFSLYSPNTREWQFTHRCTTEAEAKAWCDSRFTQTA